MTRISVDHHMMSDAHAKMKAICVAMDTTLDNLRKKLQVIDWEGADREAYRAAQAKWDAAITDMNAVLNAIAATVGFAGETYVDTEGGNVKLWTQG
jgi:ESAT-6 family protein